MQSTAWALFILLINTPFFADIVECESTDASWCNTMQRAALVVADWVLYASCDCGAQLIATYLICLNWSLISRFVIQHNLPHSCHFCDGYKFWPSIPLADMTKHTFAHFMTQHHSYSKNVWNMLIDTTRWHIQNLVIIGWEMNRKIEKYMKSMNKGGVRTKGYC